MTSGRFRAVLAGLLLIPALAYAAGGWDVVTVRTLPDYVTAGEPVRLTYAVRQHGARLVGGLRGQVVARSGNVAARATATAGSTPGVYVATLNLPRPGEWTITIHSGFGKSAHTLAPLTAVRDGSPAPEPLSDMERGRRLFVAKGCVTCHVHDGAKARTTVRGAPELTGRAYPPDYLARFLADPSIKPLSGANAWRMPDLELDVAEIAALVSFINGDRRQVTDR